MAQILVRPIEFKARVAAQRESSNSRQAAKRVGIIVPVVSPSLPTDEQEATDIA